MYRFYSDEALEQKKYKSKMRIGKYGSRQVSSTMNMTYGNEKNQ